MATAIASTGVLSLFVYISPSPYLALALMGAVTFALFTINAPLTATLQTLLPERMRATSMAVVLLFANLIGMGLGPLAAGILSDALRRRFGEDSLRYALLILAPGYFWAAWHAWKASNTVTRDLTAALAS
jgi:MFS family permease